MAATVQIVEKNGAGGTPTDKTSGTIRMKDADSAAVDTNNPIVIQASGYEYSYEKWTRLNVTVAPDTQISNLKFYTDGANGYGTGVDLYVKAVAAYATPAKGTGISGYTSAFSYTSGAPLSLGAGPYSGTGEKGDHAVLLMRVNDTATQGSLVAETMTYAWDEI